MTCENTYLIIQCDAVRAASKLNTPNTESAQRPTLPTHGGFSVTEMRRSYRVKSSRQLPGVCRGFPPTWYL